MNFEIPNNLHCPPPNQPLFQLPTSTSRYFHSCPIPRFSNNVNQSVPLTFRAMFHQYFQLGHRIRGHYLSPRVLLCLTTGKFVPPIHRKNLYSLQYSMLPARRAGIMDMWIALTPQPSASLKKLYPDIKINGRRANVNGRRYGH